MQNVIYVKTLRIHRKHFEVVYEYEDGEQQVDGTYKDGAEAERRAEVLAKLYQCDYGADY